MPKGPTVKNSKPKSGKDKPAPTYEYDRDGLIRACIILIVSLGLFIYVLKYSGLDFITSIVLAVLIFVAGSFLMTKSGGLQESAMGGRMMKSHWGLKMMDTISSRAVWFWNGLADWGLVLGFGLFSYFLFKKTISRRMIIFGSISIIVMLTLFVLYESIALSFINLPQISAKLPPPGSGLPSFDLSPIGYALYVMSIAVGFVGFIFFALVANAAQVLYAAIVALVTTFTPTPNYVPLGQSIPGVAPIIPGLDLPLVQGILALVVVLSVHELSHGVLGRIAKMKIKSSGLLVYGIIPMGAFVELDESKVDKLTVQQQNRISSAGVSSNMFFFLFFLVLMLGTYSLLPSVQTSYVYVVYTAAGAPANGIINPGSIILKWNNYNISTVADFKNAAVGDTPGANISVVTNETHAILKANATGKVGIGIEQGAITKPGIIPYLVEFLFPFFALAFLLNFLIAVVNYLPIPGLDGWRIFALNIKRKKITFAISALVLVAFWLNVLPYAWENPFIGIPVVAVFGWVVFFGVAWLWKWANEK
jgi:membrane-associated protease RseP (regulator of RpoE activity)